MVVQLQCRGRVAMLGGTGALGRLVWPHLLEDGRAVTLLARGGQQRASKIFPAAAGFLQQCDVNSEKSTLSVVDGDARCADTLAQVLDGADTLYCALTPNRL